MYLSLATRGMTEELTSLAEIKSLNLVVINGCSNIENPTARAVGLLQLEFLIMTNSMVDEFRADSSQSGACDEFSHFLKASSRAAKKNNQAGPVSYSQSLRWAQGASDSPVIVIPC